MSCFIVSDQTTAQLAEFLEKAANASEWSKTFHCSVYNGKDLYFVLASKWSKITGRPCTSLDVKKVYGVLRHLNNEAYGERYLTHPLNELEELPAYYEGNQEIRNPWQLLMSFDCYLYQCEEGKIPQTEIYKELKKAREYFAAFCIKKYTPYGEAEWR